MTPVQLSSLWESFTNAIRAEGAHYVVEGLESSDRTFYRVRGSITRFAKSGEADSFVAPQQSRPISTGIASIAAASATDLSTTDSVGDGVLVQ